LLPAPSGCGQFLLFRQNLSSPAPLLQCLASVNVSLQLNLVDLAYRQLRIMQFMDFTG
jgi:hypothetical protein